MSERWLKLQLLYKIPTVQWGKDTEPNANNPSKDIKFPISFSTVYIALAANSHTSSPDYYGCGVSSLSTTGFTYYAGTYGSNNIYWVAIGK